MNMPSRTMFLILLISTTTFAQRPDTMQPPFNDTERAEEFMDWGLGMFVHWSMDSQLGSVISHSMVGASEKYLERYINKLPTTFNPVLYDPNEWMEIAKLAGATYMVFTTKHHSGFCMWDTETNDFNIMHTPYKRDIVKAYVEACRAHGIKVGFYFSPEDFYFLHKQGHLIRRRTNYANISNNSELLKYDSAQIKELLTNYGPIDVIFLDAFDNEPIRQLIHKLQPNCLVTRGEMATPEQHIPESPMPGPWEACFTLGNQWQYKPTNEDYKSGTTLIEMLIDIRAKGGNLLINVGPDPKGVIPFEQERRFRELALWMFVNDEAIHNIRSCPVIRQGDLWFTRSKDEESVYVFITKQGIWKKGDRKEFLLKHIRATDTSKISVLGQNDKVIEYNPDGDATSRFSQDGDVLSISICRAQRLYNNTSWPNPVVVKLEHVEWKNKAQANVLSDQEKMDGWQLLFDGQSTEQWRGLNSDTFPDSGWIVRNGELLVESGGSGDIVTKEKFGDFEFTFEWKMDMSGGNSGVKYFVLEELSDDSKSGLGLEYQILDDDNHEWMLEGKMQPNDYHTTAALYELFPPLSKKMFPLGVYNKGRIVSKGQHVEHWLNGIKVLEFERDSVDFREKVQASKFKNINDFGKAPSGHILLQDHGGGVSFRNLKIRKL